VTTPAMFITVDGTRHDIATPFDGADHATIKGELKQCPKCRAHDTFGVRGKGARIAPDDRAYEADGYTTCCGAYLGTIRVEPSTIFGLREDESVLYGRVRVY